MRTMLHIFASPTLIGDFQATATRMVTEDIHIKLIITLDNDKGSGRWLGIRELKPDKEKHNQEIYQFADTFIGVKKW